MFKKDILVWSIQEGKGKVIEVLEDYVRVDHGHYDVNYTNDGKECITDKHQSLFLLSQVTLDANDNLVTINLKKVLQDKNFLWINSVEGNTKNNILQHIPEQYNRLAATYEFEEVSKCAYGRLLFPVNDYYQEHDKELNKKSKTYLFALSALNGFLENQNLFLDYQNVIIFDTETANLQEAQNKSVSFVKNLLKNLTEG